MPGWRIAPSKESGASGGEPRSDSGRVKASELPSELFSDPH